MKSIEIKYCCKILNSGEMQKFILIHRFRKIFTKVSIKGVQR